MTILESLKKLFNIPVYQYKNLNEGNINLGDFNIDADEFPTFIHWMLYLRENGEY